MAALSSKTKPNYVRLIPAGDCHYCGLVATIAFPLTSWLGLTVFKPRPFLRVDTLYVKNSKLGQ